jgi:hypothetical protein
MTSPEDDGLEEALRRALSKAASGVEPGPDGLDKIRALIGDRPPRPWLLSVAFGVIERVRHWTWRGHWAWTASLPKLPRLGEPRSRRSNFPRWGIGSLRLGVVLAGIAVIAILTLGVQPFRQAILQASAELNGDSGSRQAGARTEGSGTPATDGGSAVPTGGGATPGTGQSSAGKTPGAAVKSPYPAATTKCGTNTLPVVTGTQATPTATTPSARVTSPAASAQPVSSSTSAVTCPVDSAPKSPVPTPTSFPSASPVPTPAATAPASAYSDPGATTTPSTVAPSPPDDSSPSPSSPPDWWYRPHRPRGADDQLAHGRARSR